MFRSFLFSLLLFSLLLFSLLLFRTAPVSAQQSTAAAQENNLQTVVAAQMMAPQIEIAPLSGVSGYPIGIFGAGFGSAQGSVDILGQSATILEWTDTFIRVEIPAVADGAGNLTVITSGGQPFSQAFEVYTIDPIFQRAPTNRFTNILRGKPAVVQNQDSSFCYEQPSWIVRTPEEFLTNFVCGFQGIVGDGEAILTIPAGGSTSVAVDLGQTLSGTYYFQFFSFSGWYGDSAPGWYGHYDLKPKAYTIQVSADSTDGLNGNWLTVHNETDNNRNMRLHKIDVPAGGYRWVRMNMTEGKNEPRVKLKEIRLYQSSNNETADLDMMTVYGDSITEGAFYHIGATGLALQVSSQSGGTDEPIFTPFGLTGQNATGLIEQPNIDYDIFDAFALDNMGSTVRYWGIALGNNDTGEADNDLGVPGTNIEEFDERLDAFVQIAISQNKVPIIARIPDTNENISTDVLAAKKKILDDIDQVALDYRLIPGPDLYTLMRLNIERDNASWYWPGDPYHQNWEGRIKIIEEWADALVRGTNRDMAPGKVTQLEPSGTIQSTAPTFKWRPQPTVTHYKIAVYDQTNQSVLFYNDASPYEAGVVCSGNDPATDTCSAQPSLNLAPNVAYRWLVQAWNGTVSGPWSVHP